MDHASRLRLGYTEMLLKTYSRRMEQPQVVLAAFEAKLANPREAQLATLRLILERNAKTAFGQAHGFASITDLDAFRAAVPIVTYDQLAPWIERAVAGESDVLTRGPVSYFSTTSGTTAKPKFIPGTQQTIQAGCEAILARNSYLLRHHPQAFAGTPLFIVGNANEGKTAKGVGYGAMTGFGYHVGHMGFQGTRLPYEVFTIADAATRYYCILRMALARPELSAIFSYNPSTLVLLFQNARALWERLVRDIRAGTLSVDVDDDVREALTPLLVADPLRADELLPLCEAGPRGWWPMLAIIVCWKGGALGFYLRELERWTGDLPIRDLGVLASEAVLTIPIDDVTAGGVLLPDTGFFEFLAEGSTTPLGAWELESGHSYRVVVTTHGGLYRYDLGDIVRVERKHFQMPVLSFLHRAGRVHSFTGEKLTELQVTLAVRAAADLQSVRLTSFTAVPVWNLPPRYDVFVESETALDALLIDQQLCAANIEYASKRGSGRLAQAEVVRVARGTFERLRRAHSAQDAQYKEIHLATDPAFARRFSSEVSA
ncbi:MAG: GH3 auxin-responsive promoter family protein [Acidobacteriota bacterium]